MPEVAKLTIGRFKANGYLNYPFKFLVGQRIESGQNNASELLIHQGFNWQMSQMG